MAGISLAELKDACERSVVAWQEIRRTVGAKLKITAAHQAGFVQL
jgi:hypothetical protein